MRMSEDVRKLNNLDDVQVKLPAKSRRKKNDDKKYLLIEAIEKYGQHLPKYKLEFLFHPIRRWRTDLAFCRQRLLVEVDGGQWMRFGGRHSRDEDRWKGIESAVMGYRTLHFSTDMLKDEPEKCIDAISRALGL